MTNEEIQGLRFDVYGDALVVRNHLMDVETGCTNWTIQHGGDGYRLERQELELPPAMVGDVIDLTAAMEILEGF